MDSAVTPRRRRPGRVWYAVGALLLVIAATSAGIGLVRFFAGLGEELQELRSVDATVTLEDGEDAQIFVRESNVPADQSQLQCELRSADGTSVPLESNRSEFTYDTGSRSWRGVFYAKDVNAGEYTAQCQTGGERLDVAVGPSMSEMFTTVSGPFFGLLVWVVAVPGLLGVTGLVLIVVTAALRIRSRNSPHPPRGGQVPPPA